MSINGFGQGFGQQFQPESNVGASTYLHGPGMTTEYSSHTGGFTLTNTPNNMTGPAPSPNFQNPAFNTGGFPQPGFAGFGIGQQPQGLNNFNGSPFGFPNAQPNPTAFGSPSANQGFQLPNPTYPQPSPAYPQAPTYPPTQNNGGGLQAILAPIMQLFTMIIGMFMQNGNFIGERFEGDIDYHGPQGHHHHDYETANPKEEGFRLLNQEDRNNDDKKTDTVKTKTSKMEMKNKAKMKMKMEAEKKEKAKMEAEKKAKAKTDAAAAAARTRNTTAAVTTNIRF